MARDIAKTPSKNSWGALAKRRTASLSPAGPYADSTDPCVILLIDVSSSMEEGGRLQEAKEGANKYALAATARGYAVAAAGFSGSAFVIAPPSRQVAVLSQKIDLLRTLSTGTNVGDAIIVGMSLMPRRAATKTLVLCTDGEPDTTERRDQALAAATNAKATGFLIHAVAIQGSDVDFIRRLISHPTFLREARDRTISSTMRTLAGLLPPPE